MSTINASHTTVPQPSSWMRAGAVALAGLAIAMSIGLEISGSGPGDGAADDSRATSFEPSAEARRLGELAIDRAEYQIEILLALRGDES